VRHSLTLLKPSGLPIISATAQSDSWWQHSHLGPPWYSPSLSARSGSAPPGVYCHSSHIGRQTGVNPCGLPFAFPPTDCSGPDRLFRRGLPVLMAGDLNAKHVDWNSRLSMRRVKLLRDYVDENSCLIFGTDSPASKPIQPLRHSRYIGHCHNQGTLIPGVSDFVLCTKLGPPPGSH